MAGNYGVKPLHWISRGPGHPRPLSAGSLPSSRSSSSTRAWGKNSLGQREPPLGISCRPRPYPNRALGKSSSSHEFSLIWKTQLGPNLHKYHAFITLLMHHSSKEKLIQKSYQKVHIFLFQNVSSYLYCENAIDKKSSRVVAAIFSAGNKTSQISHNKTGSSGDAEKWIHNTHK